MAPTHLSEVTRGGLAFKAFSDLSASHADCATTGSLAISPYYDKKGVPLFQGMCVRGKYFGSAGIVTCSTVLCLHCRMKVSSMFEVKWNG